MVPAYLLSLLNQQRLALNEKFPEKFPHHWLVWEPGAWAAPQLSTETIRRLPTPRDLGKIAQGDALSFGLPLKASAANALKIGRSDSNDIVINDATVSRQHALLLGTWPSQWSLEPAPETKAPIKVNGVAVSRGLPVVLRSGQQIALGDVALTYYDLEGLMARLRAREAKG